MQILLGSACYIDTAFPGKWSKYNAKIFPECGFHGRCRKCYTFSLRGSQDRVGGRGTDRERERLRETEIDRQIYKHRANGEREKSTEDEKKIQRHRKKREEIKNKAFLEMKRMG